MEEWLGTSGFAVVSGYDFAAIKNKILGVHAGDLLFTQRHIVGLLDLLLEISQEKTV